MTGVQTCALPIFIYAFTNNTGITITSLDVAWNYEKYRSGSRAFDWTFFHGSTSTASTAATSGDQAYAADANNTVIYNPPTSIAKSFSITGLSISNGSTYYLRWTYTGVGGNTNAQGLGVDDFSITANGASNPTAATPTFSPLAGTFYSAQNVTLASTTENSTIYYTTDGSDPDDTDTPYTVAIPVNSTTTIKAIA